ncbi:hypothetical protein K7432_008794 [Basidiobolus ranarum]|uniref:N-acetyltransferase domain-containing protein n=1 Tax=Basidiobolus ranarum TaxID=34480 RepID=A0ABR2WRF1_9FUNG
MRIHNDIKVEAGNPGQMEKIIECLEEAFEKVPFHISTIKYICGSDYSREVSQLLFEDAVNDAFQNGAVNTMDQCNAVSLWFKPGAHHGSIDANKWLPYIGEDGLERLKTFGEAMSRNQQEVVGDREVWHLYMIVSNRAGRGKRLASTLLKHSLERADKDGKYCYLECVDPSLVSYYQKFNFKPIKTVNIRPEVPITLMLREPHFIELPSSL